MNNIKINDVVVIDSYDQVNGISELSSVSQNELVDILLPDNHEPLVIKPSEITLLGADNVSAMSMSIMSVSGDDTNIIDVSINDIDISHKIENAGPKDEDIHKTSYIEESDIIE